eukprot:1826462-Lingulodinium_polyedra.AAC.1
MRVGVQSFARAAVAVDQARVNAGQRAAKGHQQLGSRPTSPPSRSMAMSPPPSSVNVSWPDQHPHMDQPHM